MEVTPVNQWFDKKIDGPLIIAGPCSAESPGQLDEIAGSLKKINKVHMMRTGIWKPRTSPGTFEGIGEAGLKWLQDVKRKYGLLTTIEVVMPEHIEKALEHEVDALWIGARTTVNPITIQELAEVLQGVDIPVMVKNPVNPDISLWIGALERFYKMGVQKLAAIHRGFFPFEAAKLRNIPKWEIPIELKRRYPEIPVINDPSHISGKTDYIFEVAQKALDLDMDGLMIETHPNPEEALSDASQQVNPHELERILSELVFRKKTSADKKFRNSLEDYREQIDSLDSQVVELLAQRMKIVEKIGAYKFNKQVKILQLDRWQQLSQDLVDKGIKLGLHRNFLRKLIQFIHIESIQKQTEVMEELKEGE